MPRPYEERPRDTSISLAHALASDAMPRHEDEIFRLLCAALGRRGVPASFALASEVNSETFAAMQALAESERVLPALYDALD